MLSKGNQNKRPSTIFSQIVKWGCEKERLETISENERRNLLSVEKLKIVWCKLVSIGICPEVLLKHSTLTGYFLLLRCKWIDKEILTIQMIVSDCRKLDSRKIIQMRTMVSLFFLIFFVLFFQFLPNTDAHII